MSAQLQNAKKGVSRKIWETNMNVNPKNFYPLTQEGTLTAIRRVQKEKFVILGSIGWHSTILERNSVCDVTSGRGFIQSPAAFAVYKGFPYLEMFNSRYLYN